MLSQALFAVNRPTLALVAVGITATSALVGISWVLAGFVVANAVCVIAAWIAQVPIQPGYGPTMVLVVAVVGYLTFAAVQVWQRRRLPNFDELRSMNAAFSGASAGGWAARSDRESTATSNANAAIPTCK